MILQDWQDTLNQFGYSQESGCDNSEHYYIYSKGKLDSRYIRLYHSLDKDIEEQEEIEAGLYSMEEGMIEWYCDIDELYDALERRN